MSIRTPALRFAGAFLAAPLLLGVPLPVSGQEADERAVIEVVERLFTAMRSRDTVAMKSVFTAEAQLLGQQARDGLTRIQVTPATEFVSMIAAIPADRELIERIYQPEVQIDGDLASFWAFYTLHVGEEFSHCGVDAALLFRTAEGWKIASLADTRRRENCEVPGG